MVLNYSKATKAQLLQIMLDETCPSIYKFEAANEFRKRDKRGFTKLQAKMRRHRE